MAKQLFTVLIPCFNYGRFLRTCVESVVDQPGAKAEIIIVDDCSTDDSPETIESLVEEFGVRAIRHDINRGLIATLNHGIAEASGDYFIALSADDCLAPRALERMGRAFDRDDGIGLVFGRRLEFSDGSQLFARSAYLDSSMRADLEDVVVHDGLAWIRERCRQGINMIASPEVAVRMSVQRRIGEYDANCRHTSDLNMWLRAAAVADVAFIRGAPVACYRTHGANMSIVDFGSLDVDLLERSRAFRSALEPVPQASASLSMAQGVLADEALHEARRAQEAGMPDIASRLTTVASELDASRTTHATRTASDSSMVRADYAGRILHRLRWKWWLNRWERSGI